MRKTFPLSLLTAFFVWHTSDLLPATVASHFNAAGVADGSMSRTSYLALTLVLVTLLPLQIAALGKWIHKLPDDLINIPYKTYWLAPERRAESLAAIAARLEWTAIGLTLFMGFVHWQVVQANALTPPRMESGQLWMGVTVFLLTVGAGVLSMFWRFRRVDKAR